MERRIKLHAAINEWKETEDWQELKVNVKQFVLLMVLSIVFIVVIGIGAHLRHAIQNEHGVQQSAAIEVKQQTLQTMLAEEMSYYQAHQNADSITLKNFSIWILEKITNASLFDPATIVASELLYGTVKEQATLVHGGSGSDPAIAPQDHHQISYAPTDGSYVDELLADAQEVAGSSSQNTDPINILPVDGEEKEDKATTAPTGTEKPVAFIYHTHNRESWNAELEENERDAQSSNKNITLVGQRLAEELEKLGLGAMVSDTDYPTTVPDYEWAYSYKYSRKTVKEAIASNSDLQYIFDLHRDSQARKYTTAEINGESYAQVYFIIGQRNAEWKENEAFARKLHDKLEEQYPGLSRGIWGKNANSGNAEYNQTLSNQSVLIEVGGIDNTLEECYRTAKALAEVIAQIHEES